MGIDDRTETVPYEKWTDFFPLVQSRADAQHAAVGRDGNGARRHRPRHFFWATPPYTQDVFDLNVGMAESERKHFDAILTRFEACEIIGVRATLLAQGATPMLTPEELVPLRIMFS